MARRSKKWRIPQLEDDAYYAKLDEQHGGCAICGFVPRFKRLAGDHLHAERRPNEDNAAYLKRVRRGLLCTFCNRKIVGYIESRGIDPEKIAEYFRQYRPS